MRAPGFPFFEELVARLEATPGVLAASPVHMQPGTGSVGLSAGMMFEGQTPAEADLNPWATWEPVTPSYFRALGVPIVRGRAFGATDSRDSVPVAIVSEAVARRDWPGQDALGKRLRFTSQFPWATVVGVAGDVRYRELTRPWLTVYFPASQFFFFSPGTLVVRIAGRFLAASGSRRARPRRRLRHASSHRCCSASRPPTRSSSPAAPACSSPSCC